MMRPESYKKYIYWLPESEFSLFQQEFEHSEPKSQSLFIPERFPCEVLSPARPIGAVPPETWNKFCKRQGSWYRTGDKNGQFIVASSKPLPELEKNLWGQVSVTQFRPPRLPTTKELPALLKDPHYTSRVPDEWSRVSEKEKEIMRQYFDSKGMSISLDDVFLHQSANHANFLQSDPVFSVVEKGVRVPYSITPTELTCCACNEIFGVLGANHRKKYVMPCPGLKFVDLKPGEYYKVESTPPSAKSS